MRLTVSPCLPVSILPIARTPLTQNAPLAIDGEYLYFAPLASRQFWRIPTSYLKVAPGPDAPHAYMLAKQAVEHLGESGSNADGMETDSSGYIYVGAPGACLLRSSLTAPGRVRAAARAGC